MCCLINQLTLIQAVAYRLLTLFAFAASACNSGTDNMQEIPLGYVYVPFMYWRDNSPTKSEKFVQCQGRENEKWWSIEETPTHCAIKECERGMALPTVL